MLGFLRVTFFVLPVIFFIWYIIYHDSFVATMQKINSLQGRNGVLIINEPGKSTCGSVFASWLEDIFGKHASPDWRRFFMRSGRDLDFAIRKIEDYWVWMLASIFLISGAAMLYAFRNYK